MTKTYTFQEPTEKRIGFLPTLDYFQKMYSKSMEGADQKAATVFRSYESQERLRRLQNELTWIKDGKVSSSACDRLVGKKRKSKYGSYERWAQLMLLWLAQNRK